MPTTVNDAKVRPVTKLRRLMRGGGPLARATLREDQKLRPLAGRLERDGIPLRREAAALCCLSVGYFTDNFRLRVGEPYARFASRLRVHRCCLRLARDPTAERLKNLAIRAGFASLRAMERSFSSILGMTPRDAAMFLRRGAQSSATREKATTHQDFAAQSSVQGDERGNTRRR